MSYSKSLVIVFTAVVCSTAIAADAGAQPRGRAPGGTAVGRAVPRAGAPRVVGVGPRLVGAGPYRPFYYPYRTRISLGFYGGFGYPYFYGYPYAYGYGYPYGYAPYADGYPYGYAVAGGYGAYGGIRIEGAPRDAQVFADGYYAGIVDDYDGKFQHLNLRPGVHQIEIRAAGRPPISVDMNVTPGQTVTYHANAR